MFTTQKGRYFRDGVVEVVMVHKVSKIFSLLWRVKYDVFIFRAIILAGWGEMLKDLKTKDIFNLYA